MSWSKAAALVCMAVTAAACSREEGAALREAKDDSLAVVTARDLRSRIQALHAKAVLVNAWATWCESCEHEIPILQKLEERFAPQGVKIVLVSVDEPDQMTQIRSFLTEKGIRLKSYVAAPPLDAFKAGMNPRWPGMLPASFLFDGTGKLRYFWGGEAFEKELVPVIEGLLAGKHIDGESRFDVAPEGENRPVSK
ncbi:MAG: TlpA disulfide reductase family protein [Polyangiaceae bacterium]